MDDEFPLPLTPIHNVKSPDIGLSTSALAPNEKGLVEKGVEMADQANCTVPFRRAVAKLNPAYWFSANSVMESPKRMN
jgi:hypothetical protein